MQIDMSFQTPPLGTRNENPADIGFWSLVAEDFRTYDRRWLAQGFWVLFWHRFGNWRMGIKPYILRAPCSLIYKIMFKASQWFCGMKLPYTVKVGRRVRLEHFGGMILVAQSIGNDVTIRQNTTFGIKTIDQPHSRPVIGNGVDIGAGAVILGGILIGDNAIIGANAVVTQSIPAGALAVGVPARVIRIKGEPQ